MDLREDRRVVEGLDRQGDLEAERKEVVPVEHLAVSPVALAERRAVKPVGRDQLVRDDVDVGEEGVKRLPVLRPELREPEGPVLPREKPDVPVLVEDVVLPEPGDVVLEQPEAVAVDRPDEHRPQPPPGRLPELLRHPADDPGLQLGGRPVGEGEGDDRPRFHSLGDEARDPPGDRLGLPGPGASNDLERAPPVGDDFELGGREGNHGVAGDAMLSAFQPLEMVAEPSGRFPFTETHRRGLQHQPSFPTQPPPRPRISSWQR